MKFVLILCTVIICLLNAALVRAADRKQLSAALAAVEANLKTSAGKQYDEHFGKQLVQQHSAPIKQCKQSAPSGILDPFDLFLKLRSDGKVAEALVYPETALAVCTRTALSSEKIDSPPNDDYWVNIHLELKH